jgi:hypothetical protein
MRLQAILPPVEYDRGPYPPHLYTELRLEPDEIAKLCPKTGWPLGGGYVGCTHPPNSTSNRCTVIIATPDEIITHGIGISIEQFRRHEQSHCWGWPNDLGAEEISLAKRSSTTRGNQCRHMKRAHKAHIRNYTMRRRRLSSITRAPCRKVMGVPGQRATAAR